MADPPRPDAAGLIAALRDRGVKVKMLTGDALPVAQEVAREVGLATIRRVGDLAGSAGGAPAAADLAEGTDGFAEVYPEDKYTIVRRLRTAGHVVGMTGDGVNDAPALHQAEVGIAVSTATDVAKGAASVVLTDEGLSGIVTLVEQGRVIYQRILTWVINKISRTILKSAVVTIAFLVTGRLVISALGMLIVVFLTDFAKIAPGDGHVELLDRGGKLLVVGHPDIRESIVSPRPRVADVRVQELPLESPPWRGQSRFGAPAGVRAGKRLAGAEDIGERDTFSVTVGGGGAEFPVDIARQRGRVRRPRGDQMVPVLADRVIRAIAIE